MTLSIIVAVDNNLAIGKNNELLCHLPNDLKYFKKVTQGHTVIMGRNTYESLPNGALPNRKNIVLTRNRNYDLPDCVVKKSLEDALAFCIEEKEIFVIGGAMLYQEAIALADRIYITYINNEFEGTDAFFPKIDENDWTEVDSIDNERDDKNIYSHRFVILDRK